MGAKNELVAPGLRFAKGRENFADDFPNHYVVDGITYDILGFTEDGRLRLRDPNGDRVTVDTSRDVTEVIEEGLKNGVFTGPGSAQSNPNGVVLRAELIFMLWRGLADHNEERVSTGDLAEVGEESYYKYAVAWLLEEYGDHIEGLYTDRDLEGPVTWMELHHLIFNVLKPVSYTGVDKPKGMDISFIMNETSTGKRRPEMRLGAYKQVRWMKQYLEEIRTNKRFVPLPGFMAFQHGRSLGIVPTNDNIGMTLEGSSAAPFVEVDSNDWILMEIRRHDMQKHMETVVNIIRGV